MNYPERGTRILHHEDDRESWSFALRASMPALRGLVQGYCLYEERRTHIATHQHLPHPGLTFIIGLDGQLDVQDPAGEHCIVDAGQGFLAGLHTEPARTRSESNQRGMEINISPLGAHLMLGGMPMDTLANKALSLEDLLGNEGRELGARLAEIAHRNKSMDSPESFALVDAFLARRLLDPHKRLSEALVFAWESLSRSQGRLRISRLTDTLGWSRRRLVTEFRRAVGLPPKTIARVLRFDHALELWKTDPTTPWADVAFAGGYNDQAHFSREVRALSGQTPSELATQLLPESGGMAAVLPGGEHFDKTGASS